MKCFDSWFNIYISNITIYVNFLLADCSEAYNMMQLLRLVTLWCESNYCFMQGVFRSFFYNFPLKKKTLEKNYTIKLNSIQRMEESLFWVDNLIFFHSRRPFLKMYVCSISYNWFSFFGFVTHYQRRNSPIYNLLLYDLK